MPTESLSYVLVTPARNAEPLLEKTIEAVTRQTILPKRYVIVNDGSTDGTEAIVRKYMHSFPWIELIQMPAHEGYDLSAKARSFNAAFERLRSLDFEVIANLDSDISFDDDYFEFMLGKLAQYPKLGVAGTPMKEPGYDSATDALFNETDVFGACQVFRRQCLEQIGGYLPLKRGGLDWSAVRMARMNGWETRSFLEKRFYHHRMMGQTECGPWQGIFKYGRKDYFLGNHPVWELFRVAYQMTRKPFILKGVLLLAGYSWEFVSAKGRRAIPKQLVLFHQREQKERLRSMLIPVRTAARHSD